MASSRLLQAAHIVAAQAPPIFNNVTPNLGPLAGPFGAKVAVGLGIAYFLAFAYAGYHLLEGSARLANAKRTDVAEAMVGAKRELTYAAVSLVLLGSLGAVYAALTL